MMNIEIGSSRASHHEMNTSVFGCSLLVKRATSLLRTGIQVVLTRLLFLFFSFLPRFAHRNLLKTNETFVASQSAAHAIMPKITL